MNKNKIIVKLIIAVLLIFGGIITINSLLTNKSQINNKIIINERKQNIVSSNAISMMYETEVGSNSSSTTDSMKIGLMYVSDYGFASSADYWTTALYKYNSATNTNWLYIAESEWTISRSSSETNRVFLIIGGDVNHDRTPFGYGYRPSFYLTSSTTYVSGSGTGSDPFRIN